MIAAEEEGDRLSEEECVYLVLDVLNGGIDTTQSQLAHGIRLFAGHPDQWRPLGEDPSLVPQAAEEMLRFEPVAPFTSRVLLEDVEFRDIEFPAGTVVFASAWNANREAEGDADAERFDITAERGAAKSLTFGAGAHFCLGANLARAELQEGLAFLAPRCAPRAGRRARVRHDHRPLRHAVAAGALGRLTAGPTEKPFIRVYARRSESTGSQGEGQLGQASGLRFARYRRLRFTAARGPGRGGLRGRVRTAAAPHARHRLDRPATACTRRSGRTSHGIPHILADDFAGLGYGYGYVAAQDNICVLADIYVTVNGERSRWFGPDAYVHQGGNGATQNNLNSDFFYQRDQGQRHDRGPARAASRRTARCPRSRRACAATWPATTGSCARPASTTSPTRAAAASRGCARSPRWTPTGASTSSGCSRARASRSTASAARSRLPARPRRRPGASRTRCSASWRAAAARRHRLERRRPRPDATDNGRGMMLGNPHFPWDGSERFYESQLTIPGVRSTSSGGSLFGVPMINIGHTDNLAWSHTVSTAYRFTPFELKLVPGSPTTYLYDGQPRPMTRRRGDRHGQEPGRVTLGRGRARSTRATTGPIFTSMLGPAAVPLDAGDRIGDGRRERRQLPLPEPLLRDQPGPERARARGDPGAQPGHPVGEHDRRRLRPARPTTRTSRSCRT